MQVDIVTTERSGSADHPFYVVQFTLLAGPVRRFRRLVEHMSTLLQTTQQRTERQQQQTASMVRPRRLSDSSVSSACDDSQSDAAMAAGPYANDKKNGRPPSRDNTAPQVNATEAATAKEASSATRAAPLAPPASPTPQRRNTSGAVIDLVPREPPPPLFKGRPAAMSLKHPLPSMVAAAQRGGDASLVIANPAARVTSRPSLDAAMEEFR
ncbi:SAD-1 protein [Aphelenchoides avenae]|nr:SAD-1 protein [Aphelenchus avenae]